MQKLYLLLYEPHISLKLYLTTSHYVHDYPVPIDKHKMDYNFTPRPFCSIEGQIFKFRNYSVSCQYFY